MGVNQIALPDGKPSTVAFNVLTQLCDPRANETKMATALFTKNGEGRSFDFFDIRILLARSIKVASLANE